MFSETELLLLAERASSLKEQMQRATLSEANEASRALWAKWKKVAADNWDAVFQARLGVWNLTEECVSRLGNLKYVDAEKLPEWVQTFKVLISEWEKPNAAFVSKKKKIPFEELFEPFLNVARKQWQKRFFKHELLKEAFLEQLLVEWSDLFTQTLLSEFSIFRSLHLSHLDRLFMDRENCSTACYDAFISSFDRSKWKAFFLEYPVLARLIAVKYEQWLEVVQEFIQRYTNDHKEIEATFFAGDSVELINIEGGLSDPHLEGRTVFQLTFSNEKKLIYKPRDMHLDALFDEFVLWCTDQSKTLLDLKVPVRLLRNGYGWVEFIEHKPCQSLQEGVDFFQRAGQLMALVHILSGTDIHHENLIAQGSYPVLVDTEIFFSMFSEKKQNNAHTKLQEQFAASVLCTGFLPASQYALGEHVTIGGLIQYEKGESLVWNFLNTDLMDKVTKKQEASVDNLAILDGTPLDFLNHIETVKSGFSAMYQFLQEKKEVLCQSGHFWSRFEQLKTRYVFRPTSLYFILIRKSAKPENLRSGLEHSFVFETLFSLLDAYDKEQLDFFVQEIDQLERGDIPFLRKQICSPKPILEDEDRHFQLNLIDLSVDLLNTENVHQFSSKTSVPLSSTNCNFLDEAMAIKEILMQKAYRAPDGSLSWYTIMPEPLSTTRFKASVLDLNFYSGALGVALFFSVLGHVTNDRHIHQLAKEALKPVLDQIAQATPFKTSFGLEGLGANFYALSFIGRFSDIPELKAVVKNQLKWINAHALSENQNYDILAGSAGGILGLIAAHKLTGDEEYLSKALVLADHLIKGREVSSTGHRTWQSSGNFLTGFSHGTAGIAYALLALYSQVHEERLKVCAAESIEYERALFLEAEGNWPDLRKDAKSKTMTSWCHGAPGIGLGRLGGISVFADSKVHQEIETALRTTHQFGLQPIDNLCCGNCGRIEFLLSAGIQLNQPEWIQKALQAATQMAERRNGCGWGDLDGMINPSLFQGLAGIGYTFLRCADWTKVPNVLLFET